MWIGPLKRSLLAVLVLGWSLSSGVSGAGFGPWSSIGPYGGYVVSLAVDPTSPSTVYAGSGSGLFRSTNGGLQWSRVTGVPGLRIPAVAVAAGLPSVVYTGSDALADGSPGVFRSADGGATWSRANVGLPSGLTVTTLVVDPSSASTVWAGTGNGVFKTINGGASWARMGSGIVHLFGDALAIDPNAPSTVYATGSLEVFKTTDGGATWVSLTNGPSDFARALAVAKTSPTTVYIGTDSSGIFKSTDGGANWNPASVGLTELSVFRLVADPISPSTLYAVTPGGVFKSIDGGGSWSATNTGLTRLSVSALALDPASPSTVYAGIFIGGVFKSLNGGASWQPMSSGLAALSVLAVATDRTTTPTIWAGAEAGLFRSADSGGSWTELNTGFPDTEVLAVVVDPRNSSTVWVGTGGAGILKSVDGGATWQTVNADLPCGCTVPVLVIDPGSTATVYAVVEGQVWKTVDGGSSWTDTHVPVKIVLGLPEIISALAMDPATTSTLYAGARSGVFKSSDGGASWTTVNNGLPEPLANVQVLAIEPGSHGRTVYAGASFGVFKTTDEGSSWVGVNAGLPGGVQALVIDPAAPLTVYAGNTFSGIFQSTDGGASWAAVSDGLGDARVQALTLTPATVYVGTSRGVFRSTVGPCSPDNVTLCLNGNRFRLQVAWHAANLGTSGVGQAEPLTSDTGYFWFFQNTNVELVIKVLDARAFNGHFWVFYGALSNVEYTITVTDTQTSEVKTYRNPQGTFASVGDTAAFPIGSSEASLFAAEAAGVEEELYRERLAFNGLQKSLSRRAESPGAGCVAGPTTLCLSGGRFRLQVAWHAANLGTSGDGQPVPLTSDTGYFWFFQSTNVELVIKVLDARAFSGHFWVFYGALSNVEYTITVTDTVTGQVKTYHNPQGTFASVGDIAAF